MKLRTLTLALALFLTTALHLHAQSDSDSDGLEDSTEIYGTFTDPYNPDCDGDGLLDGEELDNGCDPWGSDTEQDGLSDYDEVKVYFTHPGSSDTDSDGLTDPDELFVYGTDPRNGDCDGDGLNDGAELITYHTDPFEEDTDEDGLSDYDEVVTYGSDPHLTDSDFDGWPDQIEVDQGTSPTDPAEYPPFSFDPLFEIPTGDGPISTVVADFDGDGRPDFAVANAYGHQISIYRNIGPGSLDAHSFASPVSYSIGSGTDDPLGIAAADIDGDGRIDLIASDSTANRVGVFWNNCSANTINFAGAVYFNTGNTPRGIAVADLNGDNKPDVIVVNRNGSSVSVLRNTASSGSITVSSFAIQPNLAVASDPINLAIGDLDGDNKPDIAVACYSGKISLLWNTTSGSTITFATKLDLTTGSGTTAVAIHDIDGDNRRDLISTAYSAHQISIHRNRITAPGPFTPPPTGSFEARVDFSTGAYFPKDIAIGDFDLDGKPDIAVVAQKLFLWRNVSSSGINVSSLSEPYIFSTGSGVWDFNPWGISVADLDRDGAPDILFGNIYSDKITLYRNTIPHHALTGLRTLTRLMPSGNVCFDPVSRQILVGIFPDFPEVPALQPIRADGSLAPKIPLDTTDSSLLEWPVEVVREAGANFHLGDIFTGGWWNQNGADIRHVRLNPDGSVLVSDEVWASLPPEGGPVEVLHADTSNGSFGHSLLAINSALELWKIPVNPNGTADTANMTLIATLPFGDQIRSMLVVPNNPAKYGTWGGGKQLAGNILVGYNNASPALVVVRPDGTVDTDFPIDIYHSGQVALIRPGKNLYQMNGYDIFNYDYSIMEADSGDFRGLEEQILLVNEVGPLNVLYWDGTQYQAPEIALDIYADFQQSTFVSDEEFCPVIRGLPDVARTINSAETHVSQTICPGENAVFHVDAQRGSTYQWRRNGYPLTDDSHISGSRTDTLTIHGVSSSDVAGYSVWVQNSCGIEESTPVSLQVDEFASPVLMQLPIPRLVRAGDNTTFQVIASGTSSYQWQKDGVDLTDNTHISGCTTPLMVIKGVSASDVGRYRVVLNSVCNSPLSSDAVALTLVGDGLGPELP